MNRPEELSAAPPEDLPEDVDALRAEVARLRAELDARRAGEEVRTRRILESITDAFFALDSAERFSYVNAQAGPLLDRDPSDLIGRIVWDAFPEAMGSVFYDEYHRARAEQRPVNFVARYEPLGRWFDVTAYPVEGGGLSVFFDDVTDRVEAQQSLRQSEARFRFLADTLPQMVWTTTPEGEHVYFNRRWYEYTGVSEGDTDGWGWADLLHPDDAERTLDRWQRALATGEPYEIEYRFRRRDGSYRWQLGRALPRHDADGTILQWVGTCTDIDDQRRMLADLHASQDRFARIVESGMIGVFFFDSEGRILEGNDAFLDIVGFTREDLGRPDFTWARLTPDEYAERDAAHARQLLTEGVVTPYEKEYLRKDGSRVPVVIGAALIEENEYDGVAFALDISERKANEQELEHLARTLEERVRARTSELARANRELELRNRELQDFAFVASHDLQEPLRKIRAFSDVVVGDYGGRLDDEGRYFLGRIQDAAHRMSVLITDLLAFSRIATKAQPFEPVDLDVVLRDVLSDLEMRIGETGGHVEADPLPTVDADRTQMRQLLQNFVGNALKFHRPGVPPEIRVGAEVRDDERDPDGPYVVLTIADNGIGFDPKFAERIFGPFQRLHTRHAYEGSGIGLAICRRIVERHGGRIDVASEEGEGTTFTVRLPLRHARGAHRAALDHDDPFDPIEASSASVEAGGDDRR